MAALMYRGHKDPMPAWESTGHKVALKNPAKTGFLGRRLPSHTSAWVPQGQLHLPGGGQIQLNTWQCQSQGVATPNHPAAGPRTGGHSPTWSFPSRRAAALLAHMFKMAPGTDLPPGGQTWGRGNMKGHVRDVVASPVGRLVELCSLVGHHHHAPETKRNGQSK